MSRSQGDNGSVFALDGSLTYINVHKPYINAPHKTDGSSDNIGQTLSSSLLVEDEHG